MASTVAAPAGVSVGRAKSKYTRVAALGFILISAGMGLWLAAGLIAGQDLAKEGPFLGGAVVAGLIGATVVSRVRNTVGKAIGIVLALAIMVMFFWVAFSLAAPGAFAEFSGATMFVVGGFSALGFGIASIVRRNTVATEATPGETRAMRIMVGIVALAMVFSAVMTFTGRSTVDAAAAAGATQVTMDSFKFAPGTYEATADQPTKLVVHNGDAFVHDFQITALDVNSGLINPGSQALVEFTAPAGEYLIRCTLHSGSSEDPADAGADGSMSALLTVK